MKSQIHQKPVSVDHLFDATNEEEREEYVYSKTRILHKKQWYFLLLSDDHLVLAYVHGLKKNYTKRRAYDSSLIHTTHKFTI
jgi:hypothetical protein